MPAGRILLKSISESKKLAALKSDGARLLYTWLIPHVDVNGCFSGDPEVIKGQVFTRLKKSEREVELFLSDLQSVGLVIRYEADGDQFIFLPTFEEKQPYLNKSREAAPRIPVPTPEQIKTNSGLGPDKLPLKFKVKVKVKEKGDTSPLTTSVLTYFNEITGQNRKSDAGGFIAARLAEGHTLEEFKHVIETKTAQWHGDRKMHAFLRPSTLFRPGHFEDYLNEPYQDPRKKSVPVGGRPAPTSEEKKREKEIEAKVNEAIDAYHQTPGAIELERKLAAANEAKDYKRARAIGEERGRAVERIIQSVRWGKLQGVTP
jgi:uncharacterized phage protein (TIGR02220 family)